MNFLMDAATLAPIEYVPIQTVYQNRNRGSHFRPVADSCRVYGRLLRFALSSLAGAAVDWLLFSLLLWILPLPFPQIIFCGTILARVVSGFVNFLLNRYFCFHSTAPAGTELLRYFLLFLLQMLASASLVSLASCLPIPPVAAKILVDTLLFFISFRIQKNWVFLQRRKIDGT